MKSICKFPAVLTNGGGRFINAGLLCRSAVVVALALLMSNAVTGLAQNTSVSNDKTGEAQLVAQLGHPRIVGKVVVSPDGRYLLSTGLNWSKEAILWDVATGLELYKLQSSESHFLSASFSHDSQLMVTGTDDGVVKVWDLATGSELESFADFTTDESKSIVFAAFSSDDHSILVGAGDLASVVRGRYATERTKAASSLYIFERSSTRRIRSETKSAPLAISADGRRLLLSHESAEPKTKYCVWDVVEWRQGACVPVAQASVAGFSANGESLLVVERTTRISRRGNLSVSLDEFRPGIWNALTGQKLKELPINSESVAISPNGRFVLAAGEQARGATGGLSQKIELWEVSSGQKLREFDSRPFLGYAATIFDLVFSLDSRYAIAGRGDGTAPMWEVETGTEVHRFEGQVTYVMNVTMSEDAQRVNISKEDGSIYTWDLVSGNASLKKEGTGRGEPPDYTDAPVVASPDGRLVLVGKRNEAVLIDRSTKKEVRLIGHSDLVLRAAFASDGRTVATGSFDSTVRLWETSTGKLVKIFNGHVAPVLSVSFTPNGHRLITGSTDGTLRFWDIVSGLEICRAIVFVNGDWAVMDPSGRFDASNGGQVAGLHWVVNNEPVALSQLKERYYEPGLLAKVLGFNKEPLRDVSRFKNPKLQPAVTYEIPTKGVGLLTVALTNRGGGIGRVQVFVNGKEYLADARDNSLRDNPNVASARLSIDLSKAPTVISGEENDIRVVAWNVENYISSRGTRLAWNPMGSVSTATPEVYAIIGGISHYAGSHLNLNFAAKDAIDMANALELGAKRLFGADKVHITLLSTAQDSRSVPPTKENFTKAFDTVREQAKATDILILYLAGHGITLQRGNDMYCYLTQEARTTDTAVLADSEIRRQTTITSEELVEWIKQIAALKVVVMLDTCAAGAAQAQLKLVDKREASGDAIRAIDRAKDRTGSYILMGSAADAVSYEASRYGQGLLTYALLKGMKGGALRNDEFVDVSKLFQYARDQVEQLAKDIGGIQKPMVLAPTDDSFEVGQLKTEDRLRIALATPRPMILRPLFFDEAAYDDTLGLMKIVRARLRDESFVTGRGATVGILVFVDDEEFPGGIRPTGGYTVQGNNVTLTLRLRRDGKEIATSQITGTTDDMPGLAVKVVAAVKEAIQQLPS